MDGIRSPQSTLLWVLSVFMIIKLALGAHQDGCGQHGSGVVTLSPNSQRVVKPEKVPDIFCVEPERKQIHMTWCSSTIYTSLTNQSYTMYKGHSQQYVLEQFDQERFHDTLLGRFLHNAASIPLQPFNCTCVGISTGEAYKVKHKFLKCDPLYLLLTIIGVLLFWKGHRLARNIMLYYATGISVGVLASLLVVVFIVSRLIPGRGGMYAVLVGGWSMVIAGLSLLSQHIWSVLSSYQEYVLGYIVLTSLGSFAVCYYFGPPKNPRTLNLIQWTIQLFALSLVYYSIQIFTVKLICTGSLILLYLVQPLLYLTVPKKLRYRWWRIFPPKPRLLTQEEYWEQGEEETRKALEELREFCQSPDCNTWKTVSRLKSPQRFASFIEGDCHVNGDELQDHDSWQPGLPSDLEFSEDESF